MYKNIKKLIDLLLSKEYLSSLYILISVILIFIYHKYPVLILSNLLNSPWLYSIYCISLIIPLDILNCCLKGKLWKFSLMRFSIPFFILSIICVFKHSGYIDSIWDESYYLFIMLKPDNIAKYLMLILKPAYAVTGLDTECSKLIPNISKMEGENNQSPSGQVLGKRSRTSYEKDVSEESSSESVISSPDTGQNKRIRLAETSEESNNEKLGSGVANDEGSSGQEPSSEGPSSDMVTTSIPSAHNISGSYNEYLSRMESIFLNARYATNNALSDDQLSTELYLEWQTIGEYEGEPLIHLFQFIADRVSQSSSRVEAELIKETILHTNNRLTNENLNKNFQDYKEELVSSVEEAGNISSVPSDILSDMQQKYYEEKSMIEFHHFRLVQFITQNTDQQIRSMNF